LNLCQVKRGKMKFDTVVVGPLDVNCYILYDEKSSDCVVIDPGEDGSVIEKNLRSKGLIPREIWLTHAHFDHLGAADYLKKIYTDVKVFLHNEDYNLYRNANEHASVFGLSITPPPTDPNFFNMSIGEKTVGGHAVKILHTPGHSSGSVCFYVQELNVIFTGDLIFGGSVGRTDLPGASFDELEKSIREQVYTKGDACEIYPGHGPMTTVGREKKHNPFVRVSIKL